VRLARIIAGASVSMLAVAAHAGSATTQPAVPVAAQARMHATDPVLAVVPTRLPLHYAFGGTRLDRATGTRYLRFVDRRFPLDSTRVLMMTVRRFPGTCSAGKAKTLQMAGNRVYVGAVGTTWRCLGPPAPVKATATAQRLPDVALGMVVASMRRVSR
jgi:hypothetical protein